MKTITRRMMVAVLCAVACAPAVVRAQGTMTPQQRVQRIASENELQ